MQFMSLMGRALYRPHECSKELVAQTGAVRACACACVRVQAWGRAACVLAHLLEQGPGGASAERDQASCRSQEKRSKAAAHAQCFGRVNPVQTLRNVLSSLLLVKLSFYRRSCYTTHAGITLTVPVLDRTQGSLSFPDVVRAFRRKKLIESLMRGGDARRKVVKFHERCGGCVVRHGGRGHCQLDVGNT